jgi:diguanylate cyclase (GGDEF)-like protein
MDFLDTFTLQQVSMVFNLLAALVWLLLGEYFRMAPRESRWMALGHAARIGAIATGLPGLDSPLEQRLALGDVLSLVHLMCTCIALRRMLRQGWRAWDLGAITAVAAVLIAGAVMAQQASLAQPLTALAVTALALLAIRDVHRALLAATMPRFMAWMFLPLVLALVLGLVRGLGGLLGGWTVLDGWPSPAELAQTHEGVPSVAMVLATWVLTAATTLSMMALLIWRLIARIQHLMRFDSLTGALNRRAVEAELVIAQALLERGHSYALVLIDIDHFKAVNDRLGHAGGDAALKHCVAVWRDALRSLDQIGRLGGEEFCVLLPGAPLERAVEVAERLRAALEGTPLKWAGAEVQLTASFGVALPQVNDPQGEVALARADAQAYRAKALGRNRVCVAELPA